MRLYDPYILDFVKPAHRLNINSSLSYIQLSISCEITNAISKYRSCEQDGKPMCSEDFTESSANCGGSFLTVKARLLFVMTLVLKVGSL